MSDIRVEKVLAEDFETILEIESRAYSVPWTREIMEKIFNQKIQRIKLLYQEKIAGYAFLSSVLDEGHLLHITIDPSFQGLGLGRKLLTYIVELGEAKGLSSIFLEVREGNTPARGLYSSMGFNEVGLRKDYYPCKDGSREDAIVMAYTLSSSMQASSGRAVK